MSRLRRLIEPVNWKYAVGELVLIVAGVLIALSANAWWESRREREREQAYLAQLRADAQETLRRVDAAIAEEEGYGASAHTLLAALQAPGPIAPDSLRAWVGRLPFGYADPRFVLGTINALQQSGDLNLLRSDTVRVAVNAYLDFMEAEWIEYGRYAGAHEAYMDRFWDAGARAVREYPLDRGLQEDQLFFLAALREDPELRVALAGMRKARWIRQWYLQRMREATERLLHVVEAAPGARKG